MMSMVYMGASSSELREKIVEILGDYEMHSISDLQVALQGSITPQDALQRWYGRNKDKDPDQYGVAGIVVLGRSDIIRREINDNMQHIVDRFGPGKRKFPEVGKSPELRYVRLRKTAIAPRKISCRLSWVPALNEVLDYLVRADGPRTFREILVACGQGVSDELALKEGLMYLRSARPGARQDPVELGRRRIISLILTKRLKRYVRKVCAGKNADDPERMYQYVGDCQHESGRLTRPDVSGRVPRYAGTRSSMQRGLREGG